MKMKTSFIIGVMLTASIIGCTPSPKSGAGFTLPQGNLERGQKTYVALQCSACHKIDGIAQTVADGEKPAVSIALGGEVMRIQTYGELVTSIINPSHRLAKGYPTEKTSVDGTSKMTNYNDVMTVTQLTDLVTFLQSKYKLIEVEPTTYYPVY
jgi:L-cysteine S-thiosulfotransferase